MENKIRLVGNLDGVKLFYDPLRKVDTFLVMRVGGDVKSGFVMIPTSDVEGTPIKEEDVDIVLESNSTTSWSNVTGIIAGFDNIGLFKKIKDKFYAEIE